jgi:hypothetical protein
VFAAPGVADRVPAVRPARTLPAEAPESWRRDVELEAFVAPNGFTEAVLFHRPSSTLVLTDLAFHLTSFASGFDRLVWRAFGVPAGFGPSRSARWTLLRDRDAVRPFLRRLLEWPFERIVVAHGDPIERSGREVFRRAYAAMLG